MAKIGVVTFSNTKDNYGQVLQYLATQTFLESFGHDVYLLVTKGHKSTLKERIEIRFRRLFKIPNKKQKQEVHPLSSKEEGKQLLFEKWARITQEQAELHPRGFDGFRAKHFHTLEGTYEDLQKNKFDAFCVGSDQTWSDTSERYMLGWVKSKAKKFTIAPSAGHKYFSEEEVKKLSPWIKSFDFITVREQNGLNLVQRTGRHDAQVVLDPTFLLTSNEYNHYAQSVESSKPYVFIYLLGGEISMPVSEIISFCNTKGYDVKYVESQGRNEEVKKQFATVGEWLGLINNASYIVTNSFHGMAFSLIYHKPFMVYPLTGVMDDMNGRILNLAEKTKLNDRIYKDSLEPLFTKVDWEATDKAIIENKELLAKKIEMLFN